jgi:predicted nicotinamide N-methyase
MPRAPPVVHVREDGARKAGCDESSGWVWCAARPLALWLADPARLRRRGTLLAEEDDNNNNTNDWSHLSILEVGAGTGWLALTLAARGAHVTATERPGAVPLLLQNVLVNQAKFLAWAEEEEAFDGKNDDASSPKAFARRILLDVDVAELEWSGTARLPGVWDCVVGSDLIYIPEHHRPLLETLLLHDTRKCFLTWEERKAKDEAGFFVIAQELGFRVEEGYPVHATTNPVTGNRIWFVYMTHV